MSYIVQWKNVLVDPLGKAPITIPVGTVNTTSTDLALTGKGAANYGALQQQNFLRLLENFADTNPPANPTVGQLWYDHANATLKVLADKSPIVWKSLGGIQVTAAGAPPAPAALGDIWFERTGPATGFLYVYTGVGRYPTTATTIGGWDQIWPTVQVFAGREEYDQVRQLVDRLMGVPLQTYGSGAIGRSVTYLTNFAALDQDLRSKAAALGADGVLLATSTNDRAVTVQAPSTTLFYGLDIASPSDGAIFGLSGGVPTPGTNGSIIINGVVTTVPHGGIAHGKAGDYFIVWDTAGLTFAIDGGSNTRFAVARDNNGVFEYDDNANWVPLTATPTRYIIGTISKSADEPTPAIVTNTVYPIDISANLWAEAVPLIGLKRQHLKVEPNSQDWDLLLAAAKYALNRLELPVGFTRLVSEAPFVIDGRQAPSVLFSFPEADPRYPSADRRSNRKIGTVTQVQAFTETLNALSTGIANRFALRGINGATGTNPTFAATTSTIAQYSASNVLGAGTGTLRLRFRFNSLNDRYAFIGSGGTIEVVLSHSAGASLPGDINMQALIAQRGVIRISGDKSRIFGSSLPRTMTAPTVARGLWNAHETGLNSNFSTAVGPSAWEVYLFRGPTVTDLYFDVQVAVNAGSALSGVTSIGFNVIYDNETMVGPADVYPRPLPAIGADIVVAL